MAQLIPAPVISKTPGERRVLEIDWSDQVPDEVAISNSTWTASGDTSVSLAGEAIAGLVTRVRVDGGADKTNSTLTNLVELSNGERLEGCISIRIRGACC
jgi:hypothetical protein